MQCAQLLALGIRHAACLGCSCAQLAMLPLHCLPADPSAIKLLHAAVGRTALARYCLTKVSGHPGALPCSRGMVGALTAKTLDEKVDVNGTSFQQASNAVGYGAKSHEVWGGHCLLF